MTSSAQISKHKLTKYSIKWMLCSLSTGNTDDSVIGFLFCGYFFHWFQIFETFNHQLMSLSFGGEIAPVCCPDHFHSLELSEVDVRVAVVMAVSIKTFSALLSTFFQHVACTFLVEPWEMWAFCKNYTHTFPISCDKPNTP